MLVVPHLSPPMMIRLGSAAWRRRRRGTRPPRFRSAAKRSRARKHIASSAGSCVGGSTVRGRSADEAEERPVLGRETAATRAGMLAGRPGAYPAALVDVFRTPDER